jgi:hypothetical protein
MARHENPPFPRGETYYNGGTIDANNLQGIHLEGKEWVFEDIDPATKTARTGRYVRCRIVRNVSGAALLPKRVAKFQKSGTNCGARVDGYANVTAEAGFPVDEFLSAAGVPNNDLFWLVMEGPAIVTTSLAADAGNNFAVGDKLVAATAATSGATTSGRAEKQVLTGATQPLADQIQNAIGRALTARTTGNTGVDVFVEVGKW